MWYNLKNVFYFDEFIICIYMFLVEFIILNVVFIIILYCDWDLLERKII